MLVQTLKVVNTSDRGALVNDELKSRGALSLGTDTVSFQHASARQSANTIAIIVVGLFIIGDRRGGQAPPANRV